MSSPLYPFIIEGCRAMVFVDGENLATAPIERILGLAPGSFTLIAPDSMRTWFT